MKPERRRRTRRGIALILAMLTAVILVTLSMAFMSLSLSESRTSRVYGYEEASIQAATYGIEYALVYMGHGKSPSSSTGTWKTVGWRDANGNPDNTLTLGFYNVLEAYPNGREVSDMLLTVVGLTDPGGAELAKFIPTSASLADQRQISEDIRQLRFVPKGKNFCELGADLLFKTDVVVLPILNSRNQGRHDFKLIATARIYQQTPGQTALAASQVPVATRVVEARVKESSFDYAHFIANGRSWQTQGTSLSNMPRVVEPNPPAGQPPRTVDLADYVMIPPNYTEKGPMRIDGQDPALLEGLTDQDGLTRIVNNSGNLRFDEGANDGNVVFTHKLSINQAANIYRDNGMDDTQMSAFSGGFDPVQARVGLPDFRKESVIAGAQLRVDSQDVSGYISIPTSDIPGARGSTPLAPLPRGTDPDLGPFQSLASATTLPNGTVVKTGEDIDFRPRFPNVEITLAGDDIKIVHRDTLSGQEVGAPQQIKQSQLAMSTLYVEGGNVVVKTDPSSQGYSGRLSIITGEHPQRDNPVANQGSIYAKSARDFLDAEKTRWKNDQLAGTLDAPDTYKTPPYSAAQLRAKGLPVDSAIPNDQMLWPEPGVDLDKNNNPVRYQVEREGNIIVADDVVAAKNTGNSLGLFAQNFVLLNDNTPNQGTPNDGSPERVELTIDAVLMSKERSVSLDWDNTGRQNPNTWKQLLSPLPDPSQQRTIRIKGSVIGEYIDVEGDNLGRGYAKQEFEYDSGLRNANPPYMPRPDLGKLPGGFRYMILHYLDRGSLSTADLLN